MNSTPHSLLERLRQPAAAQAWERFVRLYTPLLFLWARRLGFREQGAADLVQDVLVRVYQGLPEFADDTARTFRSWLQSALLDQCRNRRPPPIPAVQGPGAAGRASDEDESFISETDYRRYLVRRVLELMKPEFQPLTWRAFQAYALEGQRAAQVAADLGMSTGAVRAAKFRVLCRLRQELSGMLD
jgi:RNA polymerase sigma-70 factor (ECF subfamily)